MLTIKHEKDIATSSRNSIFCLALQIVHCWTLALLWDI